MKLDEAQCREDELTTQKRCKRLRETSAANENGSKENRSKQKLNLYF
jgi:hypothetical protein